MTKHYRWGGSTAKRTLACPGWRALSNFFPTPKESEYAADGTICHTACETLYDNPEIQDEALLKISHGDRRLTKDLIDNKVVPAFDAMLDVLDEYQVEDHVYPERTMQVDEYVGGTGDIIAINKFEDTLLVLDYKFGDGVMVNAENNDQALFYVWCFLEDQLERLYTHKFPHLEKVVCGIIQPSDRRENIVDLWETTVDYVFEWGDKMNDAIDRGEAALDLAFDIPNLTAACSAESPLIPYLATGDHCKFCPGAALCPAKQAKVHEALRIDVKDSKGPEQVAKALDLAEQLDKWLHEVKAFAHAQDEAGVHIPGWKRVAKRATRKWIDDSVAEKWLKRNLGAKIAMVSKPLTPAQAEKEAKKLKKDLDFSKYVTSQSPGTDLVRESDKRPAVPSVKALEAALTIAKQ